MKSIGHKLATYRFNRRLAVSLTLNALYVRRHDKTKAKKSKYEYIFCRHFLQRLIQNKDSNESLFPLLALNLELIQKIFNPS
jgi:hypothetical protein